MILSWKFAKREKKKENLLQQANSIETCILQTNHIHMCMSIDTQVSSLQNDEISSSIFLSFSNMFMTAPCQTHTRTLIKTSIMTGHDKTNYNFFPCFLYVRQKIYSPSNSCLSFTHSTFFGTMNLWLLALFFYIYVFFFLYITMNLPWRQMRQHWHRHIDE